MWDRDRLKSAIESILFVSSEPVPPSRIQKAIEGATRGEIEAAIRELAEEYDSQKRGIYLAEVAGGYQFRTSPQNADVVRRFVETRAPRLTKKALEVLAIIAYRQPITKPEVDKIRGVDSGGIISGLLERGLIKILGRKEVPGRPFVYGTTKKFLEVFSLKDLSELPSIEEIEEMLGRRGELQRILDAAASDEAEETQASGEREQPADAESPQPEAEPSDEEDGGQGSE